MNSKIHHLLHQRHLLKDFVDRDLRQKYAGSAGGILWAVANPLVLLVVYTFVFSVVLRVRFAGQESVAWFALYLYCGMLAWQAFSDAIARATPSLVHHGNLIRNARFPAKVLPTTVVVSGIVNEGIGLVLLLVVLSLTQGVPPTALVLPVVLLLQVLFTLGLSLLLSAVHVFFRDVEQLVRVGLLVWMFITPLFYPESQVPERLRWVVEANPLAHLVRMYRAVLLEGRLPGLGEVAVFSAWTVATMGVGYAVFTRNHHKFADVL
jgi:ABC-type polysaccharide/polyol phosphate export permease